MQLIFQDYEVIFTNWIMLWCQIITFPQYLLSFILVLHSFWQETFEWLMWLLIITEFYLINHCQIIVKCKCNQSENTYINIHLFYKGSHYSARILKKFYFLHPQFYFFFLNLMFLQDRQLWLSIDSLFCELP